MPPRNSNTKAFRQYHYDKSPTSKAIPLEKIYGTILKPEEAPKNDIEKEFQAYKTRMKEDGVDLQKRFNRMIKEDEDGDPRYIYKDWYKNKLRG